VGTQVYQNNEFKIYRAGNDFIIHNSRYAFKEKHSHIQSFYIAKQIVFSVMHKVVTKQYSAYLLTSLTRLSDDEKYIDAVQQLIEVRKQKGRKQKYCNRK
jgi:hypothetical protein